MLSSAVRLVAPSRSALSLLAPSCTPKPTASSTSALGPIRYHIFRNALPYPVGLKLQNDVIEYRLAAREKQGGKGRQDVLFLLEHTPTYTTGRRDNSPNPDELHPEEKKVQHVGAEFYITKRGGQVTYHGPGQIVGYPILDLNAMETPTRCYVEYLQALLAEYAREQLELDVLAPHPDGHVGVFASPSEKVASIGIHLRHRITSHGFSMNVTPEPIPWFDLVMACGLADVSATSLHDMIARLPAATSTTTTTAHRPKPTVTDVAHALIPRFAETFARDFVDLDEPGGDIDDVEAIRAIVQKAEDDAAEALQAAGAWPTKPDLTETR